MDLITSDDPRYDDTRAVFNGMIDKHPAVIAQCATPGDVTDALALAAREGYEVAVRAGGHSVAGMSVNDGGLVVDVRPMKAIEVDVGARLVRVGAGATWGELDRVTQEHGLATTGGRVSTTGVAGFTLGGGSGWLERRHGLACDNLVAVDLVTADGRHVTASEDDHPDLFWALHGGGGNFGVATSFVLRLHPLGPTVTAGLMMWPEDGVTDVARLFRDIAYGAPDELGSGLVFLTAPPEDFVPQHLQGETVAAVAALWAGDVEEGAEAMRPFRDLGPEVDLVGPMPYADFQCMIDDPPGMRNYWSADYHDAFPDDALDIFVKSGFERQSPLAQQILFPWGGAVARVAENATPMTKRSVSWVTHPFAVWEDPADDERNIEWARTFRRDVGHYATGGVYLNFIGDEGEDRVRAAYGDDKYARLSAIKGQWDPDNVFRGNQNIRPA
ncbi:MAG TPA: FAD-binding oxidoreductase [Acidimicrobiales bacterium]|nr:FAD-binding oxidoreductase [Acidimicrobiales bacterium]